MLRVYKRIIIVFIALMAVGLPIVIIVVARTVSQPEPTGFDNVRKQDEKGVDCGGSCPLHCPDSSGELIEVGSTKVIRIGSNLYDVIARVKNPNSKLGAGVLNYTVRIRDIDGEVIKIVGGKDFLLPREEVFLVIPGVSLSRMPGVAEVIFEGITWQESLVPEPSLAVINPIYKTFSPGETFASEVTGAIKNVSTYGFNRVRVQILLFDEGGELLSAATSDINTLQSNEGRFFKVTWPEPFTRLVRDVKVLPRTNIFDEQNILRPEPEKEQFR